MAMTLDATATYSDISPASKGELNGLILLQSEHLEKELDQASKDLLTSNGITEDTLASAMMQFSADPTVHALVDSLNSFDPINKIKIDAA
jgi:hypothetical protein